MYTIDTITSFSVRYRTSFLQIQDSFLKTRERLLITFETLDILSLEIIIIVFTCNNDNIVYGMGLCNRIYRSFLKKIYDSRRILYNQPRAL